MTTFPGSILRRGSFSAALVLMLFLAGCSGPVPAQSAKSGADLTGPVSGPETGLTASAQDASSQSASAQIAASQNASAQDAAQNASAQSATAENSSAQDASAKNASAQNAPSQGSETADEGRTEASGRRADAPLRSLRYIDAWKEWHTMQVDPSVRKNAYDPDGFHYEESSGRMTYPASAGTPSAGETVPGNTSADASSAGNVFPQNYGVLQGVDVSEHQGRIDWDRVADAGFSFAFIRVGFRGYGEAGTLVEDSTAVTNLQEAKRAGLQVGAYFFSQAISEEEAGEEAALALQVIGKSGIALDLPLMYDPELIREEAGRANDISRRQVAANTAAFRREVETSSPWKADIYANLPWEDEYFDADTLNQYSIWYADYERKPQTPYHFTWWQYSNTGSVPGIEGEVDLDLWMRPDPS